MGLAIDSIGTRVVVAALLLITSIVGLAWRPGAADSASDGLVPVRPARLLDTRAGDHPTVDRQFQGIGALTPAADLALVIAGRGDVPLDADAVMMNITVERPAEDGRLTVYPCGTSRPLASSVNFTAGRVTSNAVLAKAGAGQAICLHTTATTDVVADVQGYVASNSSMTAMSPVRLLDSRAGANPTIDGAFESLGANPAGQVIALEVAGRAGIPDDANAVMLNITAAYPAISGHVTAFPCGSERPLASSLNYRANENTSNLVFAKVGDGGRVCIYSTTTADLVGDVQGYVASKSTMAAVTPARLLDTRSGDHPTIDGKYEGSGAQRAGSTLKLSVTRRADIPTDAAAVLLNIAAANPSVDGHLTVYPCGSDRPLASSVNFGPGRTTSNTVLAKLGKRDQVCIYTSATTHLTADIQGHYVPLPEPDAGVERAVGKARGRKVGKTTTTTVVPSTTITPATTVAPATTTTVPIVTVPPATTTVPTTTTTIPIVTIPPATTTTTTTTTTIPVVTLPPTTTVPTPTTQPPSPSGFVHPGVLVNRTQLDTVKAHVAAGHEPWASALNRLYSSGGSSRTDLRPTTYRYSSLSYAPAAVSVIQAPGNANKAWIDANPQYGYTNIGDVEHLDDARAAYTHALLWYYTGNQAHANKAIEIMNAWSGTLTEIKFDQPRRPDGGHLWDNGKLQAGWGASLFTRAAEIIRYSNAGWSTQHIERFETMLTNVYLPLVITSWSNGANWLMTFSEATIGIGVFTDDQATFDAGVDMWRRLAPSTIYINSDGAMPIAPVSWLEDPTRMRSYWHNPSTYHHGLQGETLRDLSHMTMGLGAMSNAAETAYIQGIDLYAEQSTRIITGFELNAGYVNDYLDEVNRRGGAQPASSWRPNGWVGPNFSTGGGAYKSGWEIAHHHYTRRLGINMPETTRLVNRLRPNGNQAALHLSWETLTHGT